MCILLHLIYIIYFWGSNFFVNAKTGFKQPPPQALRFSHGRGERETRVTGDEPQGTMGRVQTAGPLSPSRLPLRAHFHQKRDVWVRGRVFSIFEKYSTLYSVDIPNYKTKMFVNILVPVFYRIQRWKWNPRTTIAKSDRVWWHESPPFSTGHGSLKTNNRRVQCRVDWRS